MIGLNKKVAAVVMMFFCITLVNISCVKAETELFLVDCLNSIKQVRGCSDAIGGILHWDFSHLKRACCEALEGLQDQCWFILFPHQPLVHAMVKGVCFFP
ncbi:unnamed protein product [Arabidopsis halleri]